MFGNPETTTGGLALKFYASMRMDVRKIETIKEGDKAVGSRHRVKVVKNKVSAPFRIAEFEVYNTGISREGGIMDVGLEMGIIDKSGAFFKFEDLMIGQGRQASMDFLKENTDVARKITDAIIKMHKSGVAPVKIGVEA